jgi:hypothetical protein
LKESPALIERKYLQPADMWARVENGNLLYVPVVTIHGADHAHVYLSGQVAREASGAIVGKATCARRSGKPAKTSKRPDSLRRNVRRRSARDDFRHRYRRVLSLLRRALQILQERAPGKHSDRDFALGHRDAMVEIEVEAIIEPERLKG